MSLRSLGFDIVHMKCALAWAGLSRANRRKVGAVITKNGQLIGNGFNGTPSGFDNVCEEGISGVYGSEDLIDPNGLVTKPEVLHAESNAITKVARSTQSSEGSTLYVTTAPCFDCAKLIIQAGIIRVVYLEEYKNKEGINLLKIAEIPVEQISV